jgi:hypothetical protein
MKGLSVLFISLIVSSLSFSQASKKAEKDTRNWHYELEAISEGKEGTYVVKVWSYSKKSNVAIDQAKKNAIHGVIFQGCIGVGNISNQPPLTNNSALEFEKKDFFDEFFKDNGQYQKYVSVSTDGSVSAGDRLKVGKEYKIGVVVSIRKDLLRKDLEAAGIIKSLSSGF